MRAHLIAVCFGLSGMAASPALAQPQDATAPVAAADDGWDVEIDAERKITLASIRYDSGAGLIVQCRDGELSTIILGLPAAAPPAASRNEAIARRLETGPVDALTPAAWRAAPDGTSAVRGGDARGVRALKRGGRFAVRTIAAEGAPARALVFDLPSNPAGVDQVLTACGSLLTDPRDALRDVTAFVTVDERHPGLDAGPPSRSDPSAYDYSCVVAPGGQVRDCRIESIRPANPALEERLLRSAPRARFNFSEDPDSLVGGVFYVTIHALIRVSREVIM